MKGKLFVFILVFLFTALGVLLLTKRELPFRIITLPSIHSSYQDEAGESVYIKALTNDLESPYFHKDLISNVTIKNEHNFIDMNIIDIHFSENEYIYMENTYQYVSFELGITVVPAEGEILLENSVLELTYDNGEILELEIGSFYVLFGETLNDLSLDNLFALHGELDGVDTITGIYVELYNKTDHHITIKRIETLGSLYFDNHMLKEIEEVPLHYDKVTDILLIEEYSHTKKHALYNQQYTIIANQSNQFFVPLLYNGDVAFVYRFPLQVVFEIEGEEKIYIIDDFPYINTPLFKPELEDSFVLYEKD